MQFRIQGKKIQCIRSAYDPETKRSLQKLIASFNMFADKIPSDLSDDLTDSEREELANWFEERRVRGEAQYAINQVRMAAKTLTDLAAAIKTTSPDDLESADIWSAIDELTKAIKKQGHKRPAKSQKPPVSTISNDQE